MEQHYHTITEAKFTNEAETVIDCKVNGKDKSGLTSTCRFWPSVLDFGLENVTAYEAPPEPTPLELLAQSDMAFIKSCARMLEEIADEREAAGDFVSDDVKAEKAERKALREQL